MMKALALACAVSVASATTAASAPFLFTLSPGSFDDGGSLSGSFVFDDVSGAFSSINIVVGAGSLFGAETYTMQHPTAPATIDDFVVLRQTVGDLSGVRGIGITSLVSPPVTPGLFSFDFNETTCVDSTCSAPSPGGRTATVDVSVTSVVPLPGALALIIGALGTVGVMAGRRTKTAT